MMMINASKLLALIAAPGIATATSISVESTMPPPLTVMENFLGQDEIGQFLLADLEAEAGTTTLYGSAIMPPAILRRLPRDQRDLDEHCSHGNLPEGPSAAVITKMINNSTHSHKDKFTGKGGVIGCDPPLPKDKAVDDDVGIIFLNTNDDAYFNREDVQVPVVAGTLVAFHGGFDHNTVVNSGSVRIAGPFHLKTLQLVGGDGACAENYFPCRGENDPSSPVIQSKIWDCDCPGATCKGRAAKDPVIPSGDTCGEPCGTDDDCQSDKTTGSCGKCQLPFARRQLASEKLDALKNDYERRLELVPCGVCVDPNPKPPTGAPTKRHAPTTRSKRPPKCSCKA